MRPILAFAALSLLLSQAVQAAPAAVAVPLTVEADKLEVDDQHREAVFSGNVRLEDTDMTLTADRLKIDYSSDKADRKPAAGKARAPNQQGVRQLTATGHVVISRPGPGLKETATGDEAVYSPATRTLVMTGAVALTHGANTLTGNRLVYNLVTGKATVTGSNRVHGQFSGRGAEGMSIKPDTSQSVPRTSPTVKP